jgi:hypothetical protein
MAIGRVSFGRSSTQNRASSLSENEMVTLHQPDHPRLAINLLTILQRERDIRVKTLIESVAKDYADYRQCCGVIEGLDIAIAAAKAAKDKAEA